jgi:uncharacterized protein YprB with RNaseH-like and TPR domain
VTEIQADTVFEPAGFSLLERTFIHVPMIGPSREANLWRRGFTDWNRFRADYPKGAFKEHVLDWLDPERALAKLPRAQAWRLFPSLRSHVLYLDIESTGLRGGIDEITCIGTYDGARVAAYVPDEDDLRGFRNSIDAADLLVTYNGSCFDVPFLKDSFPGVDFARPRHIDLRWPLRRMGLRGGLKGIEPQMGIFRDASLDGVDGYLAILLWRAHRRGHSGALETLVRYCLEDVVNLEPLMVETFNRLASALPLDVPVLAAGPRPELGVRADEELVAALLGRPSPPW